MLFGKRNENKDVYAYNFKVHEGGLSREEASKRLKAYGENVLLEKKKKSALSIFLNQFNDFIIWVLFGATTISALMGEKADAITITAIIVLNGIMGFIQEYRTEKSMEALNQLTAPTARVMRDGKVYVIPAREIVPDDIILLEAGDRVAADSLIIDARSIQTDESLLTGESIPVDKNPVNLNKNGSIVCMPENMVFMGTLITRGRAKAAVVSTGMATEMGKIADLLQNVQEEETPLKRRLNRMGRIMVYGCIMACVVVTATGIIKGENIYTMFLTGISLAVAAIPEGLPAIVTVSLTIGVQRMLKRNALVRRLPAVETLGCTDVICSDKTGTLTENKMTVKNIYCDGELLTVSGSGYELEGKFTKGDRIIYPSSNKILRMILESSVSCSNSSISTSKLSDKVIKLERYKKREVSEAEGDPTEIALLVCAYKAGILKESVDKEYIRMDEIPFDSNRKRMSVIVKSKGEYYVFLKGAIDNTIDLCSHVYFSSGLKSMNYAIKNNIMHANMNMAKDALRVLAVAYKKLTVLPDKIDSSTAESGLTFLGLIGMIDPPRKEAIRAIEVCRIAGIKPVMITGDHKETAAAIANQLKMYEKGSKVLTGAEIDEMDDKTLTSVLEDISVYARVAPKHKLRIVRAYKKNGHIVAMTGDGVNDAPAVKEADIGISMGQSGTDVTKEASSMILLDDNFATIISAVEEGRIIYANIRKFIRYLLSCNLGEVLTMFLASLLGLPIPLLPIQILWVNLVTDGLPAIALGAEPAESDIMSRPPRGKNESVFSNGLSFKIISRGVLIGLCTLAVFSLNLGNKGDITKARTMAFAVLVMSQLIHVFECRSENHSIFEINFLGNMYLVLAVLMSVSMLSLAIYFPVLQPIFKTVSLSIGDWIEVMFFSGAISLIVNLKIYIKSEGKK